MHGLRGKERCEWEDGTFANVGVEWGRAGVTKVHRSQPTGRACHRHDTNRHPHKWCHGNSFCGGALEAGSSGQSVLQTELLRLLREHTHTHTYTHTQALSRYHACTNSIEVQKSTLPLQLSLSLSLHLALSRSLSLSCSLSLSLSPALSLALSLGAVKLRHANSALFQREGVC